MYINFCDLPGQQNLFLDYLYEFENVAQYYKKNFRNVEEYPDHFENICNSADENRDRLTAILKEQYSDFKISKQTESNIEALSERNTIAVVTGQQLGLFGGPLYTIYKAITAIKLSGVLKERFDTYNFVPVFWLEGDDHDFEEVRKISYLNNQNELTLLEYSDDQEADSNRGSVANIKFIETLEGVFGKLDGDLRDNEFKPELMEKLKSAYKTGTTFAEAFKALMFEIFDEYGLLIFNPYDKKMKELMVPIFEKEIENYPEHSRRMIDVSATIEETYHAQVKVKPVNLFLKEKEGRFLIEPIDNEFRLRGKRIRYKKEDLLSILKEEPERFSPNVLLRPICQDFILPTGFYVGGPSEISYFAQVVPLYEEFGIIQPYIFPRASATIIEKNIQTLIEKFNLDIFDILHAERDLTGKLLANLSDTNMRELFKETEAELRNNFNRLKEELVGIDKTLGEVTDKTLEKSLYGLGQLQSKAEKAEERRHEASFRQISRIRSVLYPGSNLQEREFSFIYFAHKYGWDILKWIFNQLKINKFEHQIIEL